MRNIVCIMLCALFCAGMSACGKQATDDAPKPWAATGTAAETAAETETTRREELSTLAAFETNETGITLPQGITSQDLTQMQTVLWRAFFFRDQKFSEATAADVLPYLADSATPWGLRYIYDTLDPAHTHGTYTQLSVETDPDPRALFPDMYYRVDGSVMDFLFRSVFGVEPVETVQTDSAYCADGVWYFNNLATGMAENETVIHAWQTLGENHYRLTAELLIADSEGEMTHEKSAFVEIRPTDAEELRVWQILNVEAFE